MRIALPILLCVWLAGCHGDRAGAPAKQAASSSRQPLRYAVLVNGDSERRHRDNIARAYSTLRGLGFAPQRIFVVSPPDRRHRLPNESLRLAPAPDNFWRVMDSLAGLLAPGDLLVVYGTGHGDSEEGDALLELRQGEVWAADLGEEVERYRGDSVVVMDQCFSGGFVDAFKDTKRRVIAISSVDRSHETDCTEFARTFWDSLAHPELADRNHDGKTSVREAFDAALKAHRAALAGDPSVSADGVYRSFNGFDDATLN